jgi:hypothetical protein
MFIGLSFLKIMPVTTSAILKRIFPANKANRKRTLAIYGLNMAIICGTG